MLHRAGSRGWTSLVTLLGLGGAGVGVGMAGERREEVGRRGVRGGKGRASACSMRSRMVP
jgi:hypothetical protein